MSPVKATERKKAFKMRVEGKTFIEISRKLGISTKTVSRWENGWRGRAGQEHEGWKERLDKARQERLGSQVSGSLLVKENRLTMIDHLARMVLARIEKAIPVIRVENSAEARAMLSEVKALRTQMERDRAVDKPSPETPTGIKFDISIEELQERYAAAKAREAEYKKMMEEDTGTSNALPDSSEAEHIETMEEDTGTSNALPDSSEAEHIETTEEDTSNE